MNYSDYLNTDHWQDLKAKKRIKKNRCGICASTEQVDTHHLNYRNLFNVETSDLRLLCRRCHFLAHDLIKSGAIKFRSDNHHSRWNLIKDGVKKHLGIWGKNMFN